MSVSPEELCRVGVWEFVPENDVHDETQCQPVQCIPVSSLDGRVAAVFVHLADGSEVPALLGSVDLKDPRLCRLFLCASFLVKPGQWFHLARHFDFNYAEAGPTALARVLCRPLDRVFPIDYDLSHLAIGDARCVVGSIPSEPIEKVSHAEAVALAVP